MKFLNFTKKYLFRKDLFKKIREKVRIFSRRNLRTITGDLTRVLDGQGKIIFDIGAHHGNTVERYSQAFPNSIIYAFEPYTESYNIIVNRFKSKNNIKPIPIALGEERGEPLLNISTWSDLNSIQLPNERAWGFQKQEKHSCEVDTIDHFLKTNQIPNISILKLDVQGFEKQVLLGAHNALLSQTIDSIVIEFQIIPLYKGHTLYFDIAKILNQYGYELFNWYEINEARSGQIRWCDAIFLSSKINNRIMERYGSGSGSGW